MEDGKPDWNVTYEMISATTARVQRAPCNWAEAFQWNRPLAPVNFRVVFYRDNGMRIEVVDGFPTFDAAIAHAWDNLPAPEPVRDDAEEAGRAAFMRVSGRLSDHLRGTKSAPDWPRCPYRKPARVVAWQRGFDQMLDAFYAEDARS